MSRTPVLDLEKEPPAPPSTWRLRLIGVAVGSAISALAIIADQGGLPDWRWPSFNGLLVFPALYLAIAVHELGHLIAGRWAGFRSGGIGVGGFFFFKSGKNWTFRFDRRACVGVGGLFKPLTGDRPVRASQFAWMVAGGPIASTLLTIVCLRIYLDFGNGFWDYIGSLFWVSLSISVITLTPFTSGLNKSDGGSLLQLLRHREQARYRMALIVLQTEEAKGLLPREWNSQVFGQVLSMGGAATEHPYGQLMAFYRRLDEGLEEEALRHLDQALTASGKAGPQFRHAIFLEAAFACASLRNDVAKARVWQERACRVRKPDSLNGVEAGIAMCEGRWNEALSLWQAARREVARRKLDSGLVRFALEKWAEYEGLCAARAEMDLRPEA